MEHRVATGVDNEVLRSEPQPVHRARPVRVNDRPIQGSP